MTRDEAARAFAEKIDLGSALVGERGDIIFTGDSPLAVDHVPAPDAPLHEKLAFTGRVAEAVNPDDINVTIERYYGGPLWGVAFPPGTMWSAPDLCHAALLAALAALESR